MLSFLWQNPHIWKFWYFCCLQLVCLQVDNSGCWAPISSYVDEQFDKFLEAETRVNRIELVDSRCSCLSPIIAIYFSVFNVIFLLFRVHACLYFIAPSGHGLKALDVEFMKRLCGKVNIVPVIGELVMFDNDMRMFHFVLLIMSKS